MCSLVCVTVCILYYYEHIFLKKFMWIGKDLEHIMDKKATAAAVISRLRISNNGELKEI